MSLSCWGSGNRVGNRHLDNLGHYILFCVSAGNDNNGHDNVWPACHPLALAVGAHRSDGHRAIFSNFQEYVRVSAPGVDIWTTDMVGHTRNGYYKGRVDPAKAPWEYCAVPGTSLSSPIVAAVAAIVLSTEYPLAPLELKNRLIDSNQPLPYPLEWANAGEIGRVDAYAAVMWGVQ